MDASDEATLGDLMSYFCDSQPSTDGDYFLSSKFYVSPKHCRLSSPIRAIFIMARMLVAN